MGKKIEPQLLYQPYTIQDYEEYCKEEEIEFNPDNYYDWLDDNDEIAWDMFMELFEDNDLSERKCVIQGMLGLWNGTFEVEPVFCNTIQLAIQKCVRGNEIDKVEKIGNEIHVHVAHHDGRNHFTILFLSDIGEWKYNINRKLGLKNQENIFKLPKLL